MPFEKKYSDANMSTASIKKIIRNVERYLVAYSLSEISKWNITDKI
jgi:hypothetical protein